jgi:hypothetical protein
MRASVLDIVALRRWKSPLRDLVSSVAHPTILDRYMVSELSGPFAFGLSAFTLIFAATNILAISRLVSEEHAPLVAAVEYFLWQLPQIVVTIVPMAMLLGTLLAMQRLSGESEITALKAGGVGLIRAVAPLLIVSCKRASYRTLTIRRRACAMTRFATSAHSAAGRTPWSRICPGAVSKLPTFAATTRRPRNCCSSRS